MYDDPNDIRSQAVKPSFTPKTKQLLDAVASICSLSPATLVARIVEEKLAEIASELMIEEQSTHDRSSRAA